MARTARTSLSSLRGLPVFGVAVAGLLTGHVLAYAVAVPDPHHRDLLLARTGHGYLPAAGEAAAMFVLAGLATLVVRAWSSRGAALPDRVRSVVGLLALVQVGAFAGQEVLERLVVGAGLTDLVQGRLLAIGVVVQLAVAVLGALLLAGVARAAARVVRSIVAPRRGPRRSASAGPIPAVDHPFAGRLVPAGRRVRAPPAR